MRLTGRDAKEAARLAGVGLTGGGRPNPHAPYRSRTEAAYAAYLDGQVRLGKIRFWAYEAIKFRIGDNCFYSPDFYLGHYDRSTNHIEVKGRRGGGPYIRDKAHVKPQAAASLYPFEDFILAWPDGRGGWEHRRIGR